MAVPHAKSEIAGIDLLRHFYKSWHCVIRCMAKFAKRIASLTLIRDARTRTATLTVTGDSGKIDCGCDAAKMKIPKRLPHEL